MAHRAVRPDYLRVAEELSPTPAEVYAERVQDVVSGDHAHSADPWGAASARTAQELAVLFAAVRAKGSSQH